MGTLASLLLAIAVLGLFAVVIGLVGLISLGLRWIAWIWSRHSGNPWL
jgi:hypothetical protein